jgi:steroid 5-alpha reductase family enzyme
VSAAWTWTAAMPAIGVLALTAWAVCTMRRNVGLVDIFWSLFFLVAAVVYAVVSAPAGPRTALVLVLVTAWSLRLAVYLAARNWNAPEDHRYQTIRARNQPNFAWKSLYLVFGLQGLLAWLVSAPLAAAIASEAPLRALDWAGALLAIFGIVFESVADGQLARFRRDPGSDGRVLDRGLWRWSRHPNYFGECCVWWGFYLLAVAGGGAWTVFAPLLMTLLLLRVSGVALLEKDIGERRPDYRAYVDSTSAFVPWPPRKARCAS